MKTLRSILILQDRPASQRRERVGGANARQLDLGHLKDREIAQLSGGELQRFACAVVAAVLRTMNPWHGCLMKGAIPFRKETKH